MQTHVAHRLALFHVPMIVRCNIFVLSTLIALSACSNVTGNSTTDPIASAVVAVVVTPATLSSLSPASTQVAGTPPTVKVFGSNFASGATVTFNGNTRTIAYVSPTEVDVTLTTVDVATAGSYPIVVTNTGAAASNMLNFSVATFGISSLSPASSPVSATPTVQILGFGFTNTDTVTYNGASHASTYVSATEIDITLTATDTSATGSFPIVVKQGTTPSNSVNFTVAAPQITSVSPVGAIATTTPFTLTITGLGFATGSTVTVKNSAGTTYGNVANVVVVSSTSITATITLTSTPPTGNYVNVGVLGATTPAVFGVASAASTMAGNVQPIFTASCTTACHNSTTAAAGLILDNNSRANLVNVASSGCSGKIRVVPGDPRTATSVLVDKISAVTHCGGSTMPKTKSISAANIQTIVDWVAQGAPP